MLCLINTPTSLFQKVAALSGDTGNRKESDTKEQDPTTDYWREKFNTQTPDFRVTQPKDVELPRIENKSSTNEVCPTTE